LDLREWIIEEADKDGWEREGMGIGGWKGREGWDWVDV